MKFAFVSRKIAKDNTKHVILGTYGLQTKSFAAQINLNMPVCWAILRNTMDTIYDHGEQTGDYIFMKDPNKAVMRMYKKTSDDLDEEEEDDEL